MRLLSKLKFYGLSEFTIKFIKKYLSKRSQLCQYMYYDVSSDVVRTNIGVPQGSMMGPLLFSICINDLVNTSYKFNFLLYADDTTLIGSVEDFYLIYPMSPQKILQLRNSLKLPLEWK